MRRDGGTRFGIPRRHGPGRTRCARWVVVATCVVGLLSVPAWSQAVRVYAVVDKSKPIYVGEAFLYQIIIDGERTPGEPDLDPLNEFHPRFAGNRDVSRTVTTIINGRQQTETTKRLVMNYMLTADKAGAFTLPPISVKVGRRTYTTNAVNVTIIEPQDTQQMDVQIEVDATRCYVGQPVLVTVHWFIWAAIADGQLFRNPAFNMPALDNPVFIVEDPDTAAATNNTLNLSGRQTPYEQARVEHNGVDSVRVTFRKVLIPQQAGRVTIDPVTISAELAVERVRSRDPFGFDIFGPTYRYERFAVSTEPVRLEVLPLPQEGRPADYYGLVGRYTIEATADPVKVNVGDPITLTIRIGGTPYLKPVRWPDLEAIEALTRDFRMPSDRGAPEVKDGMKVFTQTLRARHENVTRIPPIPLSYFDVERGRYVTVASDPIPLDVAPTKVVTVEDVEGLGPVATQRRIEAVRKGLSANVEGSEVLENQRFEPIAALTQPGYAAIWAGPLAVLVVTVLLRLAGRQSEARRALRRRRNACRNAVRAVNVALAEQTEGQRRGRLAGAMKQYVADRWGRSAGSLTPADCQALLAEGTGDATLAERYRRTLEDLEAAVYAGPGSGSSDRNGIGDDKDRDTYDARPIIELIRTIEKKVR